MYLYIKYIHILALFEGDPALIATIFKIIVNHSSFPYTRPWCMPRGKKTYSLLHTRARDGCSCLPNDYILYLNPDSNLKNFLNQIC